MRPYTARLSAPRLPPDGLPVIPLEPRTLIRISRHASGEPYFGRSGGNRFDDPERVYGTCYFGESLLVALAETVLHDAVAVRGAFRLHPDNLVSRHVLRFDGAPLRLANLTGASLKRLGGHAGLSGTASYRLTQRWSQAVHAHPDRVDGFVYMSRHLNTERAIVLFDRAGEKLRMAQATPLIAYPGFVSAARELGIRSV